MEDLINIELKALTKKFKDLIAVNELSLQVHQQDIFGLIGPNGAGKSTLMKTMTTILPPTSGEALICGVNILDDPAKVREMIGYVPQLISADGNLTGYENLLLFARLYHIPKKIRDERIQQALEIVGLTSYATHYVREYSGGMIRRLEIVQAMLHHPRVLFLDEPTSGLDPIARKAVWEYLLSIHKHYAVTIMLTTHDMLEADYLCNKVAIMQHGKIISSGLTSELKASLGANATLNDVFIEYVGNSLEDDNAYKEIARRRRTEESRGG